VQKFKFHVAFHTRLLSCILIGVFIFMYSYELLPSGGKEFAVGKDHIISSKHIQLFITSQNDESRHEVNHGAPEFVHFINYVRKRKKCNISGKNPLLCACIKMAKKLLRLPKSVACVSCI
jgi:hypothetical protein